MIIHLHELEQATGRSVAVPFSEEVFLSEELGRAVGPLAGTFKLQLDREYLLARAHIEGEVELSCGRCLGPFRHLVAFDVDEALPLDPPGDAEAYDWAMHFTEAVSREGTVDLTELVRQYAILTIPAKRLCREDCAPPALEKGERPVDPRLAKLLELKFEDK